MVQFERHVWNTSIHCKSPEREKVIILAYIYCFIMDKYDANLKYYGFFTSYILLMFFSD